MAYTIKQARMLSEKTQQEMAENMGISRDTYRKIELKPETATIAQARRISDLTGVPMDSLIF